MPKHADTRTPAQKAVDAWGTVAELAADLRCDSSTIRQWIARGGLIPAKWQSQIVAIAKRKGLEFTVGDLVLPVERE